MTGNDRAEAAGDTVHHDGPAGGWGKLMCVARVLGRQWDAPPGRLGARFPETHALIAMSRHDAAPRTPASKSAPVGIRA